MNQPLQQQNNISVKTIFLHFEIPLRFEDIPKWRGAVSESSGFASFFHNHKNEEGFEHPKKSAHKKRYEYRYPLVQYRSKNRQAGIFALGEGVEAVRDWLFDTSGTIKMGGEEINLSIHNLKFKDWPLRMSEKMCTYQIRNWIPLNQSNYEKWKNLNSLQERVQLLDGILVGQLFAFASALRWRIPQRLEACLWEISKTKPVEVHGHERMAFDVLFKANVDLPDDIGLGRSTAFGYGVMSRVNNE